VEDPAVAGSGTLGRGQVKLKNPVRAKQYSGLKDCVSLTVVGRLRESGVNNRQGVIAALPLWRGNRPQAMKSCPRPGQMAGNQLRRRLSSPRHAVIKPRSHTHGRDLHP